MIDWLPEGPDETNDGLPVNGKKWHGEGPPGAAVGVAAATEAVAEQAGVPLAPI
jgi:hypothetical protein